MIRQGRAWHRDMNTQKQGHGRHPNYLSIKYMFKIFDEYNQTANISLLAQN